ncbi:MAG: TIGR04100 family radical SAM protein [Muribaculaceae bacterium]|nr:TIGR04100 family radical SAM protein [Roseburia sp.]MCM1429926.1 TIGR04100 family radical SAM protein [Muribaculaceae bacterium]MCM1493047.1 TIGR04100 family radical SAM protein [Muribaculaceae bacterium]
MASILYVYNDQVYANITNKCDCACTFCIRSQMDGVGDADTLWHQQEPALEEVLAAIDAFDFNGYREFVFCGYGEPTCALETLLASARYVKEKTGLPIRVNSNGLGNLYHGRDIVPELAEVVDSISISLNAPNAEEYEKVTRPSFPHAYEAMLDFAESCGKQIAHTQLSIVDVLPGEDIRACQKIADSRGVHLKIRKFEQGN